MKSIKNKSKVSKRVYLAYSVWFDTHKYDIEKIKVTIKKAGGKNIRLSNYLGWSNQPKVICFNVKSDKDMKKIEEKIRKSLNTNWIYLKEKDW